jgi:MFS transporter, DHA1 family, tetracycline resistance protein
MYAVMLPYIIGCLCSPAMQSLMSRQVAPTEQGELQGGITSLMSLAAIGGPIAGAYAFGTFARPGAPLQIPGMAFFVGAGLFVLAFGVSTWVFGRGKIQVKPAVASE